jgi:hypothetical protein
MNARRKALCKKISQTPPQMPPTTESRQDEDENSPSPSSSQDREKASVPDLIAQAKQQGRGIRRLVTLCGTIRQLVAANNDRSVDGEIDDSDEDDNEDDGDDSPERNEERTRCVSHGHTHTAHAQAP